MMLIPVPTERDILVFQKESGFMTIAADSLGAIGMKSGDVVRAPHEICGRLTARVCLMETLAVGARPVALVALTCNEREPAGAALMAGIGVELAAAGFSDLPMTGSTEDNMPTSMTALGVTLLGECLRLAWRRAREGDGVYLLGRPCVGEAVLTHLHELPQAEHILRLRELPEVGDVIPCGSRGAAWELDVLERETGLRTEIAPGVDMAMLRQSAGPATCALFTAGEQPQTPPRFPAGMIMRLGSLRRNRLRL